MVTLFDFGLLLEIRELSPHFSTELRIVTNLPEVVLLRGGVGAQLGLGGPVSSGPLAAPSSKDEEHTQSATAILSEPQQLPRCWPRFSARDCALSL